MNLIEFFEKIAVDVDTLRNANSIRMTGQPGADLSMNTLYGQQFANKPKYVQSALPQPYSTITPPEQMNRALANHADYLQSRGLLDPANRPAFDQMAQDTSNHFNLVGAKRYKNQAPLVGFSGDPYDATKQIMERVQGPNPELDKLVHRQNTYKLSAPTVTAISHNPVTKEMVTNHELSEWRSSNPKLNQVFRNSYEPGQISQVLLPSSTHRGPQPIEDMIVSRTLRPSTKNPTDIRDVEQSRGLFRRLRKAEFSDMSDLLRNSGKDRLATILENARDTAAGASKIKSKKLNCRLRV